MTNYQNLIDEAVEKLNEEVRKARNAWLDSEDLSKANELYKAYDSHMWHEALRKKFKLHPVVLTLLKHKPADAFQLTLEWPHVAETDSSRLAYTRSVEHGQADRQTLTSIGKYIKRHWPDLPDHVLRDAQALFCPDKMEIGEGTPYLVQAAELGPRSCMCSAGGNIPFYSDDHAQMQVWISYPESAEPYWDNHPYAVYQPQYGWKMAIRLSGGRIDGRCLLLDDGKQKVYVRSYARGENYACQSQTDHVLEAWLNSQGFSKLKGWPEGCKLAAIDHPTESGYLLPYIDGWQTESRRVELNGDYFVRDNAGAHICDNTDGTATEEGQAVCEDCDSRVSEEDMTYVRYHDISVCSDCIRDNYVEALSGDGSVLMQVDAAANGYTSYDHYGYGRVEEYLDPENIPDTYVYIDNREAYCEIDNTVRCTDEQYYFLDDPTVVRLKRTCPSSYEDYAAKCDAWQDGCGDWYSDSEDFVLVDGEKYLQDECWQCALTGEWHLDTEDCHETVSGKTYSIESCERVSSDAEWGDDEMNEIRTSGITEIVLEEIRLRIEKEREEAELAKAQKLAKLLEEAKNLLTAGGSREWYDQNF